MEARMGKPLGFGLEPNHCQNPVQQRAQVIGVTGQPQFTGFDLGKIQKVVDEAEQMTRTGPNQLQLLALLRVQRPG
jgi:hypothetical protein